MVNPIEQLLAPYSRQQDTQLTNIVSQARNLMQQVQGAKDPKAAVMQMIGSNPQAANVWKILQTNGDLKSVAMEMARQRGIDPAALENELRRI